MEERIIYITIPLISAEYEIRCSAQTKIIEITKLLGESIEKTLGIDKSVIFDAVVCLQERNIPVSKTETLKESQVYNGDHLILV